MGKVEIIIGIAVFIYALYIYQVSKDSGKKVAFEKIKEHIIVGGGTVAVLAGSIWLAGTISGLLGFSSAEAKIFVWFCIVLGIPVLGILLAAILLKRKK